MTLPSAKPTRERLLITYEKMPFCAEAIQNDAILCRYCNRDLPPIAKEIKLGSGKPEFRLHVVLFTVAACVLAWFIFTEFIGPILLSYYPSKPSVPANSQTSQPTVVPTPQQNQARVLPTENPRTWWSKKAAQIRVGMTQKKVIELLGTAKWVVLQGEQGEFARNTIPYGSPIKACSIKTHEIIISPPLTPALLQRGEGEPD